MRLNKYQKESIVRAIIDDIPKIDTAKRAETITTAIVKAMSPEVRKLFKTKPQALRTKSLEYADPHGRYSCYVPVGDVTDDQLHDILKPFKEQENEREMVRRKLKGTVEACSTLKQLNDLLPEFKAYFPTEMQPTKNLPAVANLMTDITKLGWPKDKHPIKK